MTDHSASRRRFLQQMSGTALALATAKTGLAHADAWQTGSTAIQGKLDPTTRSGWA